jgi:hypothetical protein
MSAYGRELAPLYRCWPSTDSTHGFTSQGERDSNAIFNCNEVLSPRIFNVWKL